jgi:nucleotide-binding universal stress UspA family protein
LKEPCKDCGSACHAGQRAIPHISKEIDMRILFAVDGSKFTERAAHYLAEHFNWFSGAPELHLLHVEPHIPRGLHLAQADEFVGKGTIARYYKEESEAALAPAERILREQNIPFHPTYRVGDIAHEICTYAHQIKADIIVMGSHGHSAIGSLLLGSTTNKVLATAHDFAVLIVR